MMLGAWLIVALAGPAQAPEKLTVRAAAMLLDFQGKVVIRPAGGEPKAAALGDLLYPGERLAVPPGGAATVAILGVGTRQTLRPGVEATIGPRGCTPPEVIAASRAQRPAVARTLRGLKAATSGGRKAGVVSRDITRTAHQATTPIDGATVASDRPGLAWPPYQGATAYRVKLLSGAGRELWRVETKEPHADFPADKPALRRDYNFLWEVTDQDFRRVAAGEFTVASESELKQLEELKGLADSPDRADQLALALSYRRLGAIPEAIAAFERLVQDAPDEPWLRQALDDLRRQAGRGRSRPPRAHESGESAPKGR